MGACQSTAAASDEHLAETRHTAGGRPGESALETAAQRAKKGYNSVPSTASEVYSSQHDAVGLKELMKSLKADGALSEAVVRMETPLGIPIEQVYDGVHDGAVLGSGVSGVVRLVKHKATGIEYAAKSIDLGLVKNEEVLQALRNEINIMCQVDHPNIVRLDEIYESDSEIYLVQELCLGGDMFDRLDEQPDYHYTENHCARLVKQMLSAVRYLHSKKIIHRDLKLENFLFTSVDPESELKMIDFGLSKHFQFGELQHDSVGTPYSVAPEVIKGSYDERCDIWAIGVITYLLLSGETPFGGCDGENLLQVRDNILRGTLSFDPEETWQHVSDEAKNFIATLLRTDYHDRPSAKEAQEHPWLQRVHSPTNGTTLSPNVVKALVSFKEYSDLRKLLYEVLSFTLLPEQIMDLRGEFEKLDTNGDGEITLEGLKQVLLENAEAGSLGALTEPEVEDIFNALRVRKTDTTIRWHEFIAAGLSQCHVDERNLQLAFDRLDSDHNGYITLDDITDLMGSSGYMNKDELKNQWVRSIDACDCNHESISYEDFLLLMKGQREDNRVRRQGSFIRRASMRMSLKNVMSPFDEEGVPRTVGVDSTGRASPFRTPPPSEAGEDRPPLVFASVSRPVVVKQRSRSLDEPCSEPMVSEDEEIPKPMFTPNTSRAVILPGQQASEVSNVIWDDTKSPLVVNKQIYRAHREMRLAVLEASKRFEHKKMARTVKGIGPALVMRRGSTSMIDEKRERIEKDLLQTAKKRAGRTRRYRTASDLTGMVLEPTTPNGERNRSERSVAQGTGT